MFSPPLTLAVTGASGFIGTHLLARLSARDDCRLRVLSRRPDPAFGSGCAVVQGDLADPRSLHALLDGADTLINLAWPSGLQGPSAHRRMAEGLARACLDSGVKRLLHVSTAMVVGRPGQRRVDEDTTCRPRSAYEHDKLAVEMQMRAALEGRLDFAVLRPTAVFGAGSLNLRKLAATLLEGPSWQRHLLRFFHGQRHMHLVPVEEVVDTLLFFAFLAEPLNGETYLVSADREPANRYQSVDALLGEALGIEARLSSRQLPAAWLKGALALLGRSQNDPQLYFDAAKLAARGFVPRQDFTAAIRAYAAWYRAEAGR
ncbi:NAD-dependent epimerase/dehydratase family protein [Pseudomonas sp. RIT-PI-AD]|uniref:NAD-dependent epimerase/dehydratase family protein n=1 Tax=Pseudomonas sp. RIT-PI-AD TaxID=3035294 RepID=UPI0021D884E5|nr:NAD-dependent epimerase/dehydratase family protein [Pseudomonas sp. RIT-PI-AD]